MRRIGLGRYKGSQVKYFIVDDEDYQKVKRHTWYLSGGSVSASIKRNGVLTSITIGKYLLDTDDTVMVRFINGNSLDARRCNLIACKKRNCSKIEQNGI